MPCTLFSLAASSAPRPQPPATWKTTFAPWAIWSSASSLHGAGSIELLRVAVDDFASGLAAFDARLVAGDVVVDRRDLLAADRAGGSAALVLEVQAGHVADEVAGLLLLEEHAGDVGGLALEAAWRRRR